MRGVRIAAAAFTAAVFVCGSASAGWLAHDDEVIKDAGTTAGMADACDLNSADLITQSALYIGIHAENDQQAEVAGQLFQRERDAGRSQASAMLDVCPIVPAFVDGKVNRFRAANATRSKISD